jgi:hypothetical protein
MQDRSARVEARRRRFERELGEVRRASCGLFAGGRGLFGLQLGEVLGKGWHRNRYAPQTQRFSNASHVPGTPAEQVEVDLVAFDGGGFQQFELQRDR